MNNLVPESWNALVVRRGPTIRKGITSLSDQALVSANTFLTNLICIRVLSKEDYGIFAILFTIYLFLNHFQAALVTWPLLVLSKGKDPADERRYFGSTLMLQLQLSGSIALLVLVVSSGLKVAHGGGGRLVSGLLMLGFVVVPLQILEYVRRVLFAKFEVSRAFKTDIVFVLCNLLILSMLAFGILHDVVGANVLTPAVVLLCLGTSALGACLYAVRHVWRFHQFDRGEFSKNLRENWYLGKSHLGNYAGSVGMIQANTWIIGAMGGVVAAGAVESARSLLAPLYLFTQGLGNFIFPMVSERFAERGASSLKRFFYKTFPLWVLCILTYCLVIAVAPEFWLSLVLGERYVENTAVVYVWCSISFLSASSVLPQWMLFAMQRQDAVMQVTLTSAFVSIPLTVFLMNFGGVVLGLGARLVGEVIAFTLIATLLRKHLLS